MLVRTIFFTLGRADCGVSESINETKAITPMSTRAGRHEVDFGVVAIFRQLRGVEWSG